ncbi:VCBS repeat-containing protein [Streptomyces sp. YC504]|uniref:VCBS repeat-containing protein n=1 Tax=Streptomyces mesophilus TaxID=1775132 RepID=A0A6G4XLV2_9ACTN|nr:FG-GAP-like repeat-containing protein [Streptomyces mesophilus]NGO77807.1 VCBS repeat-containing protein [Streptomyces mesophilus]
MTGTPTSRRGLRLASGLIAAGLTLTAAPYALAAEGDDSSVMKLTSAEAEKLADRIGVDVYGDASVADDETAAGEATSEAADGPVTFTAKSTLEGVRGIGATVPAAGGQYFTVHSLGNIQLHRADGSTAWARTNTSLYADWQVKPLRPWQQEPYPARILMGYNAVSPFAPSSDQGYDTGDLTGDGIPDLVFAASVGDSPYRPFSSPGSSLYTGTFVTVLDGRTGNTLWSKIYSYASMVKIVDGTLLVADAPRLNNGGAPATETAKVHGIRFGYGDGKLTPSKTWTYDTGEARIATWGALADVGGGKAALSWNLRKFGGVTAHGTTLVLDTADGSVKWATGSDLYGRQLHLDAARGRVVALEQADTMDAVKYELVAYDLASGARTTLDTRINALATAMTVGDVSDSAGAEYAVAESTLTPYGSVNAATIRVLEGKDGATVDWTHTVKRDAGNTSGSGPSFWDLDAVGGRLVASAQDDRGIATAENPGGRVYGALTALNGSGKVIWRQQGVGASPLHHQVYRAGGADFVRLVDQAQNIRTYNLGTGKQKELTALQGDLNYGQTADLNGDKKPDVIAGGTSNGVWAWSGPSLVAGGPKQLWKAQVPGAVRNIATGDVDGDGKPEVVVAADTATVVLDGATGKVRTTIGGAGEFVRSVTVDDVNGDGKDEILVPTDALRVYDGSGAALWTYSAPTERTDVVFSDTVVADGRVHTQYTTGNALFADDAVVGGAALDGATGKVEWNAEPKAPERAADGKLHGAILDHGTFASPKIPYADGHAVVHTWIVLADPTVAGDLSTAAPRVIVEIRDGRTGELLHQDATGGPWSHGNFFIDDASEAAQEPLYAISFGTFRGFGAGGIDTRSSVVTSLRTADFATGPGGRKLVIGGTEAGVAAFDPSQLTTGDSFQSSRGGATLMGGRTYLAADLDGNGVDDVVSLNFDDFGVNRAAELLGGGVLSLNNAIHQMTTFTLS